MKKLFFLIFLSLVAATISAQNRQLESLIGRLNPSDDIGKTRDLVFQISSMPHGEFELLKREKLNLKNAEATGNTLGQMFAWRVLDNINYNMGDLPATLNADLNGARLSKENRNNSYLGYFLKSAGLVYALTGDGPKSLVYYKQAAAVAAGERDTVLSIEILSSMETAYKTIKKPDSALYCARRELSLFTHFSKPDKRKLENYVMSDMAEAMNAVNKLDSSINYSRKALASDMEQFHQMNPEFINIMVNSFLKKGQPDSAIKYGLLSYSQLLHTNRWDLLANACVELSKAYEGRDDKKSIYYLHALLAAKDSSRLTANSAKFQSLTDRDQQYEQDLKDAREKLNARVRLYLVLGAAFALLIIGIILWRNYKRQKLNNHLLSEQKEEIAAQRDNLANTLGALKSTQTQLIQSEKMASLGELTAGIAHEIQNPLNFVNNFSEVSVELLDELKEEEEKGNSADVIAIANDLSQNLQKISLHGKRAEAIVKGMLEHSRSSTGQKEPTDINQLADECIRLSYHGLRAKDKSFNSELVTNFDATLPKVNAIPQDIGRVLLNLFNNAFYAVNQKAKTAGTEYKPEVSVSTSTEKGQVIIKVKDNGIGIPDTIREKIMQPFFTTKPTGEGTGLGLSLTYDMVVKGHGGSINVESVEGEGSEFTISLPLS